MAERDIPKKKPHEMDKYPSNSIEKRETRPVKARKVVAKPVSVKRKGFLGRFTGSLHTDDPNSIKNYIIDEVAIPYIKTAIREGANVFFDMLFDGSSVSSGRSRERDHTSYSKYYSKGEPQRRRSSGAPAMDDLILGDRSEAQQILTELSYLIRDYGEASVGDLYDMLDIGGSHTDYRYGWTSLRGAGVQPVRGGYRIKLPNPTVLD